MDKLFDICQELNLLGLFLHGSRATGHARPDSDYDFAFLPTHEADPRVVENRLIPALAEAFGCEERDVDLQNLRLAPPHFRVRVTHYGKVLYCGNKTELARFHAASVSMDRDTQYHTRPYREALRKRIREGTFAS